MGLRESLERLPARSRSLRSRGPSWRAVHAKNYQNTGVIAGGGSNPPDARRRRRPKRMLWRTYNKDAALGGLRALDTLSHAAAPHAALMQGVLAPLKAAACKREARCPFQRIPPADTLSDETSCEAAITRGTRAGRRLSAAPAPGCGARRGRLPQRGPRARRRAMREPCDAVKGPPPAAMRGV